MLQKAYQGKDNYIFISYAHKDKNKAFKFIEKLQEKYNVWYDEGIHFGKEWDLEIQEKLKECRVFMFLISPNSISSDNCLDEINYARIKNKPFVNVLLEDTKLTDDFNLRFGRFQMLKLYEKSLDSSLEVLEESIIELKDTYKKELLDVVIGKKKSKKKGIIITFLLLFLVLAGASGGVFYWYINKKTKLEEGQYSFNTAQIEGNNAVIRISDDNDFYNLSDEINIQGNASWGLYYDENCNNEISNKTASNNGQPLSNGNNYFYIKIISNGKEEIYKMNIYKYYDVVIKYMIDGEVKKTVIVDSGTTYNIEDVEVKGYTINGWKLNNELVESIYLEENVTLTADATWDIYNVKIDSEYANLFDDTDFNVHYGDSFNAGVVDIEGYSFVGWEVNGILISDSSGYISNYNFDFESTLIPRLSLKAFNVSYDYDDLVGSVIGDDSCYYNRDLTIQAAAKYGYKLSGFNVDDVFYASTASITFSMPSHDVVVEPVFEEIHTVINGKYQMDIDQITYGLLPQTLEEDQSVISQLNAKAGNLPESANYYNWLLGGPQFDMYYYHTYNNYGENNYYKVSKEPLYYYIDIDLDNNGIFDYRGVYLIYNPHNLYVLSEEWRKIIITDGNDIYNSYPYRTVQWFKYEPIKWTIYKEDNLNYYALSDVVLGRYLYNFDFPSDDGKTVINTMNSEQYLNPDNLEIEWFSNSLYTWIYRDSLYYKRHGNIKCEFVDYIEFIGAGGRGTYSEDGLAREEYSIRYTIIFKKE